MAAQPADHDYVQSPSPTSEHRDSPSLPKQPAETGAASYETYLQGCIQKNLDRPDLVTPSLVDAQYLEWLSGLPDADTQHVMRIYAGRHSAGAFRLWGDNEARKAGYASRYGYKQFGLGRWAIARDGLPRSKLPDRHVFIMPNRRTPARSSKRMETTNYIFDTVSRKVFVLPAFFKQPLCSIVFEEFRDALRAINSRLDKTSILTPQRVYEVFRAFVETALAFTKPEVIEYALEKARVTTMKAAGVDLDITQEPNTEWKFTMVLLPHCVHYNQLTPSYDEFCRATQAINPYAVITEELTNEAWRAVFECRVELGMMTRVGAGRAIAAASSPYARLYWKAAAKADAKSPPTVQKRPTTEEYDELVNFIHPSFPTNRMFSIDKVGEGLIIPLSQPTWCLRPLGEEFASFTTYIEWLNPGITYEQVVEAWSGLDWSGIGIESRTTWAQQQTVDTFAEKHWGQAVVEAQRKKCQQENELGDKMIELSKVTGPPILPSNELRPMPVERSKARRQSYLGTRQPNIPSLPTTRRASTGRRSSAPGPTTRTEPLLYTQLQDPNAALRARGAATPRRLPPVNQCLSLTKPA